MEVNKITTQEAIIEGLVKFRDGKKWKSRWCVIKKLSPVADCIHLQLFRDAKDKLKGALPKASLSLRHYMGCETGFILDKESHTLAMLSYTGPGAVLAFSGPEELLCWKTRASRALSNGINSRFSAYLVLPGPSSGIKSGPVALHVRPSRICMVSGVPPKIIAVWNITDLRRYGVVNGQVCFEGGTLCGNLNGPWAFKSDKPNALITALDSAAPSPNKESERFSKRFSEVTESTRNIFDSKNIEKIGFETGWNLCNNQSDSESSAGFSDSTSVVDHTVSFMDREKGINRHGSFSKYGSYVNHLDNQLPTPSGNNFLPSPWAIHESDRSSLYSHSSGCGSEYLVQRRPYTPNESMINKSQSVYGIPPDVLPKRSCPCRHSQNKFYGPYQNYDVPKPPMPLIQENPSGSNVKPESLYDKPKNLIKCLLNNSNSCNCLPISTKSEIVSGNKNANQEDSQKEMHEQINGCKVPFKSTKSLLTNYMNIDLPTESVLPIVTNKEDADFLSDLKTLEAFESSAEILRNAGFSQDEIDDLENLDENNSCSNYTSKNNVELTIKESDESCLTVTNDNDQFSSNSSHCVSEISDHSISMENSSLNRRKSSSADFLKKIEEFDITKSTSYKNISLELNPLNKKLKFEYINNFCDKSIRKPMGNKCENTNHSCDKDIKQDLTIINKLKESVKIRRSSSVPNKSLKNRDSSSSNDSGVSTGSFKYYLKTDLSDDESITTANSCAKHMCSNLHNRRTFACSPISTTSDTMQRISFQFDKAYGITKSFSTDAGHGQCLKKNFKGFSNCEAQNRRSPSSCGSELSDYLETLSVSSISSNEVCNRSIARPRSGREYSSILPVQLLLQSQNICHRSSHEQPF